MKINTLSLVLLGALAYMFSENVLPAMTMNGFKLDTPLVAVEQIMRGGPPRDGIPSIDHPEFVAADDALHLKADDRVLGLVYDNEVRAYPISILNWHEIVNDKISGQAVVISYCPLCGTGMAFTPEAPVREFGVSGLLYNSDVLLYDRETESLWSQIMAKSINGPQKGKKLKSIPLSHTSWQDWSLKHPDSLVLSTSTGYKRDYSQSPYSGYEDSDQIFFPVSASDERFHIKEWVLGIKAGDTYKAYPFSELRKIPSPIKDEVSGNTIEITFDKENNSARAHDEQGKEIHTVMAYWFAWYTFHPHTKVFRAP